MVACSVLVSREGNRVVLNVWNSRKRLVVLALAAAGLAMLWSVFARASTVVPVPNPVVWVTTESGGVTKKTPVPIGGVPVPIDVDSKALLGVLTPDIDVAVGLVRLEELPGKPLVPYVVVARSPLAILRATPAPALKVNARIEILDVAQALKPLAAVDYGFSTPSGTTMPPRVVAKLVGPLSGGFVDPLQAVIDSPGHSAPLAFRLGVRTDDLDARFKLDFDALPERIEITEDPRDDGLDVVYEHDAPVADVHLRATATLTDRSDGSAMHVRTDVERLPRRLALSSTTSDTRTTVDYDSSSDLARPDIRARYRDLDASGGVRSEAELEIADLPHRMRGALETARDPSGNDVAEFEALDGEEIGSVRFHARNWSGEDATLPPLAIGNRQAVDVVSRRVAGGALRYRAAGLLFGVRAAAVSLDASGAVRATTEIGDGVRPLHAHVDLDERNTSAGTGRLMRLDTSLSPLPRRLEVTYAPSRGGTDPLRLQYRASTPLDVAVRGVLATGAADACGSAEVTCLDAGIDDVPRELDVELPGPDGRDTRITSSALVGEEPDLRAVLDHTGASPEDRTVAHLKVLRVPSDVRGRVDVTDAGLVRAAEFHGCAWSFERAACDGTEAALGRVEFTVRNAPEGSTLPERDDTVPQFLSVLSRDESLATGDEQFEAAGRVDEVRHVAFRQRDTDGDGRPDGTIGAQVDVGDGAAPFDVVVDTEAPTPDAADATKDLGATAMRLKVHVDNLPTSMTACLRRPADAKPVTPGSLPPDGLLAACDRDDVLGREPGELDTTPLSVDYKASQPMTVTTDLRAVAPKPDDGMVDGATRRHTTELRTTIAEVPGRVRLDVLPGAPPQPGQPGRKLEARYVAEDADGQPATIDTVSIDGFESRRATDRCADPRPARLATCLRATIHEVPGDLRLLFDPDATRGDIELVSAPPRKGHGRPSIDGLELTTISPGAAAPLRITGSLTGLTPRLTGRFKRADIDGQSGPELAEVLLDACRDAEGDDRCDGTGDFGDGIGQVALTATNSTIGYGLPPVSDGPADVADEVAAVVRDDRFRVRATMSDLREMLFSRLDEDGDAVPTARVRMGFGSDGATSAIRGYFDSGYSGAQQLADVVVRQVPRRVDLCLRPPVEPDDVTEDGPWCGQQDSSRRAIQLDVGSTRNGQRPDVDVRRLLIGRMSGRSVLTGDARIQNLGGRIDVLAGRELREEKAGSGSCSDDVDNDGDGRQNEADPDCRPAETPDVLIEGRNDDGGLADVAGRVSVRFQNFLNRDPTDFGTPAGAGTFPWKPMPGMVAPAEDPANASPAAGADPGGTNHVTAVSDQDGRFLLDASVPSIKRLAIAPGPCYTDDRVRPAVEFAAHQAPVYRCARVTAAQHKPLGFAFRSLDDGEQQRALAIEEGHIRQMPAGEEGFEATIATLPASLADRKLCSGDVAPPCRPPVLSIENDRDGQSPSDTALRARLLDGPLGLLDTLERAEPSDEASARLDYDEAPRDWPAAAKGARLKIGTMGKQTWMRAGLNLDLPRYLDLYSPSSWACKSLSPTATDPAAGECQDAAVSSAANLGYESSDLFVKLVGAENHHDGTGHDYLGRVSLFLKPYDIGGSELVLTGAPPPDGTNGYAAVQGGSSVNPENVNALPTGDPSFYGAKLPGHLDIRVQTRNDYNATQDLAMFQIGDGLNQQHYTQVDGRINRPMSLALRLNGDIKLTREGRRVSATQLTAFNLTSSNDADAFDEPTFRLRSELRPSFQGGDFASDLAALPAAKALTALLDSFKATENNYFFVSPILPTRVESQWLDVKLNADPLSDGHTTGSDAARTVDVVAGPFGAVNQAELRGWKSIHSGPADFDADCLNANNACPDAARITPQATVRLSEFDLGAEIGASLYGVASVSVKLTDVLDVMLSLTGDATERAKLSQVLSALKIYSGKSGPVRVDSDVKTELGIQFSTSFFWGLIDLSLPELPRTPGLPQDLSFLDCQNPGGSGNTVRSVLTSGGYRESGIGLTFPDFSELDTIEESAAAPLQTAVGAVLQIVSPISCLFNLFHDLGQDKALVTQAHPAPRYANAAKPLEGADPADGSSSGEEDPGAQAPQAPQPEDVVVENGEQETYCGMLSVGTLHVKSGGTLTVGAEGTPDPQAPNPASAPPCDGSLKVAAESVIVEDGGTIKADALRTSPIPNQTGTGSTYGAGGGKGGAPGDSAGTYGGTGGGKKPRGSVAPDKDFGAPGQPGGHAGAPGKGGGTIVIGAEENITIEGSVTARGSDGEPAPPTAGCLQAGGGGGSGGMVHLTALRVLGDGTISVAGGNGASDVYGGGGGAVGHVEVNSITRPQLLHDPEVGNGGAGVKEDPNDSCAPANGANGAHLPNVPIQDIPGVDIQYRAAYVELDAEAHPEPVQKDPTTKLKLRMIQDQSTGPEAAILLCRRDAPSDTPHGIDTTLIDWPEGASVTAGATCSEHHFSEPTHGADEYRRTVTVEGPSDGWAGWNAYAVDGANCLIDCTQPGRPKRATARLGIDGSAPYISRIPPYEAGPFEPDGTPGCPEESVCLDAPLAELDAPVVDPMSGVHDTRCRVNGGDWLGTCGLGALHRVPLGGGDGLKNVDMQLIDRLANAGINRVVNGGQKHPLGRFFLDRRPPETPAEPTITYPAWDKPVNGWHHVPPTITATATDEGPTSGFGENGLTVFIGADDQTCGAPASGTAGTGNAETACAPGDVVVPEEGNFEVRVRARDRAGNVSGVSRAAGIRVDSTPPSTQLFLSPTTPDGEDGWYRTRPLFAFATEDAVGGSGVSPSDIEWQIDDGPWQAWEANSEDNVIPEGKHTICWRAKDRAGNAAQPACKDGIRVDPRAPKVTVDVDPQTPTGENGWHVAPVKVTVAGDEPLPANVNQSSGLAGVSYQVNGGPWKPQGTFTLGHGVHEIRARGFDHAGNRSIIKRVVVRVDTSAPVVDSATFPPAPNSRGWWRQAPKVSFGLVDEADGSGPGELRAALDGAPEEPWAGPRSMPEGEHVLTGRGRDRAGNDSTQHPVSTVLDTTPPTGQPTGIDGSVVLATLTGKSATLRFTAQDAASKHVRVQVVVYNAFGVPVRRIAARGPLPDGYRLGGAGSVTWNGKNDAGRGVLPGLYHFRVHVVDEAGNAYLSTESKSVLVVLGLL